MAALQQVRPADSLTLRFGLDFSVMIYAFCRWRGEGLFHLIFHEHPNMTLEQFLDWNYSPGVEPVGCYVGDNPIGIGWICKAFRIGDRVEAEVGAAFFRGTPPHAIQDALDLFLEHALIERGYDAIYGRSASFNPAATFLTKYCGMSTVDALPWGETVSHSTVITKLDAAEWRGRRVKCIQ